jgi:hypothetical protein
MDAQMDKAAFLATLRAKHAEWEALLAEVGEARMVQPGVAGEWSVKDIVAHVTWGEREMAGMERAAPHVIWSSTPINVSKRPEITSTVAHRRGFP